jgi:hypothetical protein
MRGAAKAIELLRMFLLGQPNDLEGHANFISAAQNSY